MNTDGLLHKELSHAIVGAAMKLLNTLKPGLDEKAYENALAIELILDCFQVETINPRPACDALQSLRVGC